MDKQKWSLLGSAGAGAGLGAGLMYLLDPQGGRHRRTLARDKTVSALKTGGNAALEKGKHLGNKTKGLVHKASARLHRSEVEDPVPFVEEKLPVEVSEGNGKLRARLARAWKPASLVLTGAGGAALLLAGIKRRDKVGTALSSAGLGLLAHSFTRPNGRDKDLLEGGDGFVGLDKLEDRELQTTLP